MELKRISDTAWEIPAQGEMKVPVVLFSSPSLLDTIRQDKTLTQARNVACLPGIIRASYVMPDGHQGYGFPIGGVAAFDRKEGILSPGGVGYDINCGVRLLRTDWKAKDILPHLDSLLTGIFQEVPAGVGKSGLTRVKAGVLKDVCVRGAEWAVENGYG
ncbi:MAG: RtcB family protein, partial [Acidobacteria bacterium]|nr:RtcB family protein [Acidobacteriota bacterium]